MTFEVTGFSLDELVETQRAIEREIRERARTELQAMETRRTELLAMLNQAPVEIVSTETVKTAAPAVAKFRDPTTGKTWTGRGKRPGWFDAERADEFRLAA